MASKRKQITNDIICAFSPAIKSPLFEYVRDNAICSDAYLLRPIRKDRPIFEWKWKFSACAPSHSEQDTKQAASNWFRVNFSSFGIQWKD